MDAIHLLIETSIDSGLIVHLEDVSTCGSIDIKIAPRIAVERKNFCIQRTIVEDWINKFACRCAWCSLGNLVLK